MRTRRTRIFKSPTQSQPASKVILNDTQLVEIQRILFHFNKKRVETKERGIDSRNMENIRWILRVLEKFGSSNDACASSNNTCGSSNNTCGSSNGISKFVCDFKKPVTFLVDGVSCKSFFSNTPSIKHSSNFIFNNKIQGKSGSLVFYTEDFKYAIKTIRYSEMNVLVKKFRDIHTYCMNNPKTLLARIEGIFCAGMCNFIVMRNVFEVPVKDVFDLKGVGIVRERLCGSAQSEYNAVQNIIPALINSIRNDVEFLKSQNLMDYSLIIGKTPSSESEFLLYSYNGDNIGRVIQKTQEGACYVGIVDILTEFTLSKRLECILQALCCIGERSCKNPKEYAERFMRLVEGNNVQ